MVSLETSAIKLFYFDKIQGMIHFASNLVTNNGNNQVKSSSHKTKNSLYIKYRLFNHTLCFTHH